MLCPFCATENPEGAGFCKKCGRRMDAKINCPTCGALNDGDALFCNACGKRIDLDSDTIPNAHDEKGRTHVCDCTEKTKSTPRLDGKKLLELIGGISAILAVLFSLIFLFFTGLKTELSDSLAQILSISFRADEFLAATRESMNIYYFFGEGYREVKVALDSLAEAGRYNEAYAVTSYLYLVFGTIVSAGMIIAVPVLAILATIRFLNKLLGQSDKPVGPLAMATYFTFLGGSLALLVLYNQCTTLTLNSAALRYLQELGEYYYGTPFDLSNLSGSVRFNSETVAGIVLGGIFIGLYLATRIASRGKELLNVRTVIDNSIALVGMVFALLFISFASGAMGGFTMTVSESKYRLSATSGFSPLTMLHLIVAQYTFPGSDIGETIPAQILLYSATLLSLAVVILGVVNVFGSAKVLVGKRAGLTIPIVLTTVTICYLIVGLITVNAAVDALPLPDEGIRANYTTLILTTVFSFLCLLTSIATPIRRSRVPVREADE